MVGGEAVLETVRATGVFGHVAPDGTDLLARRVGGVVITARHRRPRDVEVRHPGLEHGTLVGHVKFKELAHLGQHDQDALRMGDGAPREPCARTTGHKWDVGGSTFTYDGADFVPGRHRHR